MPNDLLPIPLFSSSPAWSKAKDTKEKLGKRISLILGITNKKLSQEEARRSIPSSPSASDYDK